MKKIYYILFLTTIIVTSACNKNGFEQIRQKGTPSERLQKANEFLEAEECFKAQSLYELSIGDYRGKPEQEMIYYNYAKSHYCQGNYLNASYYFQDFSSMYPNSKMKEEADFMVAYSYYQMSPSFRLDQTYTEKAIDQFQLFINTHPTSEKVSECNNLMDQLRRKLAEKSFHEGRLYFDLKQYEAATFAFANLLRDFPESPNAEEVRFLMAKACFKWAENSIASKQAERYEKAQEYAEVFLGKYDISTRSKEIENILNDSKYQLNLISNE